MDQSEITLQNFLLQNKDSIISKWFKLILQEYPAETTKFWGNLQKSFTNPVGNTFYEGIKGVFEELLQEKPTDNLSLYLDKIIRIKAVQDLSPSQAIYFLIILKGIVREAVSDKKSRVQSSTRDLLIFENKIDEAVLLAFNLYTECREKIYQLRLSELRKRCELLEKVNKVNEI